jgi:hypothetical protein
MTNQELLIVGLIVVVLLLFVAGLAYVTLRVKKVLLGLNELLTVLKKSGRIR